jgi:hypothetical protein
MLKNETLKAGIQSTKTEKTEAPALVYSTPLLVNLGQASTLVQGTYITHNFVDANGWYRIRRNG